MSMLPEPRDNPEAAPTGAVADAASLGPPWRKLLLLGLVVAGLLTLVYCSPLRAYLGRVRELSDSIKGLGWLGPLVLCGGVAVLVGAGVPRLLFCVLAGTALGFWPGLFWTQLGTLAGNYAVFILVRWHGRGWAEQYLARRGRLRNLVRSEGVTGVLLARQLPVPGLLINLTCGLLPLRHRDYLIGTLIGQLPQAIPATLIGAGALESSFGRSIGLIGLAVLFALAVWMAFRLWLTPRPAARSGESPAK